MSRDSGKFARPSEIYMHPISKEFFLLEDRLYIPGLRREVESLPEGRVRYEFALKKLQEEHDRQAAGGRKRSHLSGRPRALSRQRNVTWSMDEEIVSKVKERAIKENRSTSEQVRILLCQALGIDLPTSLPEIEDRIVRMTPEETARGLRAVPAKPPFGWDFKHSVLEAHPTPKVKSREKLLDDLEVTKVVAKIGE